MAKIRSWLNRLNFYFNRNPQIHSIADYRYYIPKPFQTIILISADFELAWASRYYKFVKEPLAYSLLSARRERQNIEEIINLCYKYTIPITWATVGHLFLEHCELINSKKHPEIPAVPKYRGIFWDYLNADWFENDPCTNFVQNPEWYAPDIIKNILESPVKHEIGCHTFSHIDCRDGICPPELMHAELRECKRLAKEFNLQLSSFVHPGHTIGNLDVLAREGFTNFRTDYRNVLGYPKRHENGLWELEQTAEFVFRKDWPVDYHIWRYIEIIKRAIKSNTVCVFWFHPSCNSVVVEKIFPPIFQFINDHRNDILITTHNDYCTWLDSVRG